MGRKYILTDDFDGKELPEDTEPIRLSLGRTTYRLYLSQANHAKLQEALAPFIDDAETEQRGERGERRGGGRRGGGGTSDRERMRAVREWARANNIQYNGKPLGDRGRIPSEIVRQYEEANS